MKIYPELLRKRLGQVRPFEFLDQFPETSADSNFVHREIARLRDGREISLEFAYTVRPQEVRRKNVWIRITREACVVNAR